MDKFGAALSRVGEFFGGQGVDAPAASLACFQDGHTLAGACEFASRHQARSTGADDQKMRAMRKRHCGPSTGHR